MKLKCIQINLRHSKSASLALAQTILDFDVDVPLTQEPFAFSGVFPVVTNIPPRFSSFYQLSSHHAYGAVILVRNNVVKAGRLSARHLSTTLRFISVYLKPSLVGFALDVSAVFDSLASPFSIIGSDSNGKSNIWNSVCTDKLGSDLEAFLPLHKLNIANRQLEQLDFFPGGTSFIGLTLTGDQINLSQWRFLSTPFLSDHPYIYFEVELANFEPKPLQTLQRRVSSPPLMQVDLFRTNLANSMRIKPSEPHLD